MLKSDLEAYSIEIKEFKQKLDSSSRYKIFSPRCEVCGTLKGKLLHATKENSEVQQEGAYLSSHLERIMLKSDLEACSIEIKELKQKIDYSSRYKIFSPRCEVCGTLKGKLLHATKENSEVQQEGAYLSSHLERIIVSEKMIEEDLSRVKESSIKSTYKLGVGFERCEDKGERVLPSLFLPPIITKRKKHSNQSNSTTHPIPSHPSTPREA
jgi:2-hydroxy-3-keto-5-methylthiopentenyl-1-phosphate phosphatase